MSYRFLLMPATWEGAQTHVARPINNDFVGKAPWVALVRADRGDLAFVTRAEMSDRAEIARAAAEARHYHAARRFKWSVLEKTWGFFGLFSKPTLISADGDFEIERMLFNKRGPRYGVTMTLAGINAPDDGAPEVLFTPSAMDEARKLLDTELICVAMPKRGTVLAVGFHPFETFKFYEEMRAVHAAAGPLALATQLFRAHVADGIPAMTLIVPEQGGVLLNMNEDDDAGFAT